MSQSDPEYKIVMIGDAYVGKTSIVNRYWGQQFNSNETPTIAASYIQVPAEIEDESTNAKVLVKLNIWDTAGTEKFQCLVPLYARTADSLVIVFDVTNPSSFEGAKKWYTKVLEDTGTTPISVLCANKCDLNQEANLETYRDWAETNHIIFKVTSALTGANINETFQELAVRLYKKETTLAPTIHQITSENKKSCC